MAYVIAEPCIATCDTACVKVCPVDCIDGPLPAAAIRAIPGEDRPGLLAGIQLYIDPETCTSCGACATECPAHAIFEEDELPSGWAHYRELNAQFFESNR